MLARISVHFVQRDVEVFKLALAVESEEEGVEGLGGWLERAARSCTRERVDLVVHLEGRLGGGKGAEESGSGGGEGAGAGGKEAAGD